MYELTVNEIFNFEDVLTAHLYSNSDRQTGFRLQIHVSPNSNICFIMLYIDWWKKIDGKVKKLRMLKNILIDYLINNNIKYKDHLFEPCIEVSNKDLNNLITLWKLEGVMS